MSNTVSSNRLEKSKGIVLFAYNTDNVDYLSIAEKTAHFIKKFLKLPITLITDQNISHNIFDKIIVDENKFQNTREQNLNWRNGNRYKAYELSPYDETILLDCDYIIMDDSLLKLFNTTHDYRIFQHTKFLDIEHATKMGPMSLDFLWATGIIFKKTLKTKLLFDMVRNIQKNYLYYYELYQINSNKFRNDFAFTIANNIINGYAIDTNCIIPWKLISIHKLNSIEVADNMIVIRCKDRTIISPFQNLHIMDKEFLLSETFTKFKNDLCNLKIN